MTTLIHGGIIVNDGTRQRGDIIVEDDRIKKIVTGGISTSYNTDSFDVVVDATGCMVLPGIIDSHVHFRDPGLTHKGDMHTESLAALAGGVTTVFDMPNTKPQTTSLTALQEKQAVAKEKMHVNYAFFPGVTNDNLDELRHMDMTAIPGFKLFMGSSTGNMLVDGEQALESIFRYAGENGIVLMAHCEDTETINQHMAYYRQLTGTDDPDVRLHPLIRDEEACLKSSEMGVRLAQKYDTRFHIAHVSTARELEMIKNLNGTHHHITCEATVAHLLFSTVDYDTLGTRIKCNPAVKGFLDRESLRHALTDGSVCTIGTDHAPHTMEEKEGGCAKAMSGMPMVQFSLVAMLSLVDDGVLSVDRLVQLMAHNPATLFGVRQRGFIREGYKADITLVKHCDEPWILSKDCILSRCGWSPLEGKQMQWSVKATMLNGKLAYADGKVNENIHGEPVKFDK